MYPSSRIEVKAHVLRDCTITPERWASLARWDFLTDWQAEADLYHDWIGPTCLLYHPGDGLIYVGLTALDGDVLYAFDPQTTSWESCGYPASQDTFATKLHKSLILDDDGVIWGAMATLYDPNHWPDAPGGQIFSFDPRTREYRFFGVAQEHDYIQGIVMDKKRGIIYGDTWPNRVFFRFDIASGEYRILTSYGPPLTEQMVIDDDGGVWHTWDFFQWSRRYALFRYDPDLDKVEFLKDELPNLGDTPKTQQIDTAVNGGDGYLYFGTMAGAVVRIQPRERQIEYLGKPLVQSRCKGLIPTSDGLLYGAGGSDYNTHVFSYDRNERRSQYLGALEDAAGTRCWLVHDMERSDDGRLWIAECDVPARAGYLWEVKLNASPE